VNNSNGSNPRRHPSRRKQEQDRDLDRSTSSSRPAPGPAPAPAASHYVKTTSTLNDASRNGWLHNNLPGPSPSTASKSVKSSKSKDKEASTGASAKAKESKSKESKIRYETYLDMSGDEKYAKDGASKKRRWLFGK